tara:strand:- start:431 stop:649 length:219 start_codon:yes stop_codon:yes gene_type:complete
MIEILRTNDPVKLSFAQAVMAEIGVECFALDGGMSGLYGGGLPFIEQRLMVDDSDAHAAKTALARALAENES